MIFDFCFIIDFVLRVKLTCKNCDSYSILLFSSRQTVRRAVRLAREVNVFLVFVVLDNPVNKDSILDIKVPIFRSGKLPEIKSYMEQFPFPFYIILRDINSLPMTLSDALRQWFELVTSMNTSWSRDRLRPMDCGRDVQVTRTSFELVNHICEATYESGTIFTVTCSDCGLTARKEVRSVA